ncbi:class I SAM-dependent methyltransferase [Blastopirellula sp. J2-11]|uniref:class I SAM-dependent methyltransferase n=1 Tax=Blastopirellula sp. J2-11 TaxID=2943192 RepID=UPI0021C7C07A|nr:class I SAM-dependent methyltransferase [Blastopirellula sp. J2-11]UUO07723.1 class I SAM-dependent methyltransferase [Blastopirellula sp. J2-11]
MSGETTPYQRDLAYVHSAGYSRIMLPVAHEMAWRLRDRQLSSGTIVDLGCGAGQAAGEYTAAGYDAIGVDLSPAMIELAQNIVSNARFEVGSWTSWPLPPCVAISALGEVICYLSSGVDPVAALQDFFAKAFTALAAGGLLVFDVVEIGWGRELAPTWTAGEDWHCLVKYQYEETKHQLTRRITTFRAAGELYRRQDEVHRQQLFGRDEVAQMLEQAGFQVEVAERFGDFTPLSGRAFFAATKR